MLVLSRRNGEAICIRDQVVITVLSIRGNRVQLGIEAPADVAVRRRELDSKDSRDRASSGGAMEGPAREAPLAEAL
jgi:carbon storage regulator